MERVKIFGELSTKNFFILTEYGETLKFLNEIKISIRPNLKMITCDISFHNPAGIKMENKTYAVEEICIKDKGFK